MGKPEHKAAVEPAASIFAQSSSVRKSRNESKEKHSQRMRDWLMSLPVNRKEEVENERLLGEKKETQMGPKFKKKKGEKQ